MEKGNEARNGGGLAAWLKRSQALFIVAAIIVMAAISLCYFYPDAMQGNVLSQHDVTQGIANGQEAKTFTAETGERTWWTNSLFSGMPMFQIAPSYGSSALLSWINDVYGLWLPSPANLQSFSSTSAGIKRTPGTTNALYLPPPDVSSFPSQKHKLRTKASEI